MKSNSNQQPACEIDIQRNLFCVLNLQQNVVSCSCSLNIPHLSLLKVKEGNDFCFVALPLDFVIIIIFATMTMKYRRIECV